MFKCGNDKCDKMLKSKSGCTKHMKTCKMNIAGATIGNTKQKEKPAKKEKKDYVETAVPLLDENAINNVFKHASNSTVELLNNIDVIRWVSGDLSFLPHVNSKTKDGFISSRKKLEDEWGLSLLNKIRPGIKLKKQWTGVFGQIVCEDLYKILGVPIFKPVKKEHHLPDFELSDIILEVKSGTYYTTGTAHEKVLGVPFKYVDVPELYSKKVKIICIAGAERRCRDEYGIIGIENCTPKKKELLDIFNNTFGFEFVGISDLMKSLTICD
jgi:hypothetical protein